MTISCVIPADIPQASSLSAYHEKIAQGQTQIVKYQFKLAQRDAEFDFQLRLFHPNSNIKIQTGRTKRPLPQIELIYATDVLVIEKNGLILTNHQQPTHALLHPFYHIEHILKPTHWDSAYVSAMGLANSGLKVMGVNCLKIIKKPQTIRHINEPVFFFGTPYDANYSHYVWDSLSSIWFLQHLQDKNIKLLVEHDLSPYKLDFLKALGFDQSRLIMRKKNEGVLCSNLYVGTNLSVNNRWILPEGLSVLERLRLPVSQSQHRRFFLDRNDDRKAIRRLVNEEHLWEICQKYNFERITPGRLSLADKQEVFSQAAIMVGQYGGGMQNHFLCQPNTKLLVLQSDTFQRDIFDYTSQMLNIAVTSIFGRAYISCNQVNNSNFLIDEQMFELALLQMIATDQPLINS